MRLLKDLYFVDYVVEIILLINAPRFSPVSVTFEIEALIQSVFSREMIIQCAVTF